MALPPTKIGLALSTIDIDANAGGIRYIFDMPSLIEGLAFSMLVIGLFAVSELLILVQGHRDDQSVTT